MKKTNDSPDASPEPFRINVADVGRKRAEAWLAENRDALESSNAFVEAQGLPLARYLNFGL
jgi:post-segregation antitoxin (ccd killing protein)